jgi:MFS family permease
VDSLASPQRSRTRASRTWTQYRELSRDYWTFFFAALFYDAGLGLYFFLFNLYLLDLHFDEKAIGLVGGSLSLGQLAATLPAGMLSRRFGNRSLLLFLFAAVPLLSLLRAAWVWEPAQIGLAFAAGLVMCIWGVCFLPLSAALTTESNRASAIGLIFSVGVGATALGSAAAGYLSHWIGQFSPGLGPADIKRAILVISCAVAAMGLVPLLHLPKQIPSRDTQIAPRIWDLRLLRNPFLNRYLPCMALWSCLTAAFTSFAAVYFVRDRHLPFTQIGLIFSISQIAQLVSGLLIPLLVNRWGMLRSIFLTLLGTSFFLIALVAAGAPGWSVAAFIAYSATQWIATAAIYTHLMNEMPEADRPVAAAMTMFSNSLAIAGVTPLVGALLVRFHYPPVLLAMALLEAALAIAFPLLLRDRRNHPAPETLCAEAATD